MDKNNALEKFEAWETLMQSYCSGRQSAFELSGELLFQGLFKNYQTLSIADLGAGYGGWSRALEIEAQKRQVNLNFSALDTAQERLGVYQRMIDAPQKHDIGSFFEVLPRWVEENRLHDVVVLGWTAHEVYPWHLQDLYGYILRILKPQGVFLMADFVSGLSPAFADLGRDIARMRRDLLLRENSLQVLKSDSTCDSIVPSPSLWLNVRHDVEAHVSCLNQVGFTFVEEVWRYMNHRMLLAIAPPYL